MLTYQLFESGFCRHCERMTLQSGMLKQREYPSTCALINHPEKGFILFDTGYSHRFFQLTQRFPFSLYRYLTPVTLKKSLKDQLKDQNIAPTDINYVVISHFHSDHIAGLSDFPNAHFICHPDGLESIRYKSKFRALLKGFLPDLLPSDFYQRTIILGNRKVKLEPSLHPFRYGYDVFGDKRLIAIPLPGHAKGHIGLYFKAETEVFLIADSCWHQETFKELIYPSHLTYLIHDNKEEYINTIKNLHELYKSNKNIEIIPTHCKHSRERTGAQKSC
ncbi:Zn-dependent hydrolase [Legionella norrlandica]|uniref:Zn-dependent hydrolase n=1 Tax=Legionella norrlandica TaxID=1498499 RepID=A0A0A2SXD7_9GAMM|nr:MBL fold metallo-hydrolase [Legionella norrlandica]KGP64119.1 Zn-dependent hydrolase [Legionella norrlandica]